MQPFSSGSQSWRHDPAAASPTPADHNNGKMSLAEKSDANEKTMLAQANAVPHVGTGGGNGFLLGGLVYW